MTDTMHQFEVRRHARVLVAGDAATATEAWLILHGYGMQARGMLHWFRSVRAPGRVLIAPEATSKFYAELSEGKRAVGASWNTREDLAQEIEDNCRYLDDAVDRLLPGAVRLEVHGFSQGVSVGARWCVRTRRPVARLVCWAGAFPEDVTADVMQRSQVSQPLHLVVGDHDTRVLPSVVEHDASRLRSEGLSVELHRFTGGHRVDDGVLDALTARGR